MTLESIYYIGQTVAVLAILISLIAIFFQMRQTQAIERANAQRELLIQTREWFAILSKDEGFFNDICECMQEYNTADRFKKQRFNCWAFNILLIIEQVFYQNQEGLMNDGSFNRFIQALLSVVRTTGGAQWWQEAYLIVGTDVGGYLTKRLEEEDDNIRPWDEILTFMHVPDASSTNASNEVIS